MFSINLSQENLVGLHLRKYVELPLRILLQQGQDNLKFYRYTLYLMLYYSTKMLGSRYIHTLSIFLEIFNTVFKCTPELEYVQQIIYVFY